MPSTSARALNAGSIGGCACEMRGLQEVEDRVIQITFADALRVRPIEPIEEYREGGGRHARGLEPGMDGEREDRPM